MKQEKTDALIAWLANSGGYVSGDELAAVLHTTTRSVRNYVAEINRGAKGEPLIRSCRNGYCWNLPDERIRTEPDADRAGSRTPQDRVACILRQLLFRGKISYDALADRLLVSSYTLDEDLNRVRQIFRPFGIHIHRRGDILRLAGPQIPRRKLIMDTIYRTENIAALRMSLLQEIFPNIPAEEMARTVTDSLQKYGLSCYGEQLYELTLLVTLQLEQIRIGNVITEEWAAPPVEIAGFPDLGCARELADRLEVVYGVYYPPAERRYLTLLLIARAEDGNAVPTVMPDPVMLRQAELLITRIGKYLRTDLISGSFVRWLGVYLQRMTVRQALQLTRPCPLRTKMRSAYPSLYGLTADFLFSFSKTAGVSVSSEEICWLAIILASYIRDEYVFEAPISCSLMLPVAPALADRICMTLKNRMGSLLEVRQVLLQPDTDRILPDARLLISLLPMQEHTHFVQISPFPKSSDFRRIYDMVLRIKLEGYVHQLKEYVCRYTGQNDFLHAGELKSRKALIQRVCGQLTREGIVPEDYERYLMGMESFESSGFDNLVAVPFAAHPGIRRNCLYIVTTENHISWKTGKINLFFFLVCRDPDNMDFRILYDLLIKIFCQPRNVQAVSGSRSLPEFLDRLDHLI